MSTERTGDIRSTIGFDMSWLYEDLVTREPWGRVLMRRGHDGLGQPCPSCGREIPSRKQMPKRIPAKARSIRDIAAPPLITPWYSFYSFKWSFSPAKSKWCNLKVHNRSCRRWRGDDRPMIAVAMLPQSTKKTDAPSKTE